MTTLSEHQHDYLGHVTYEVEQMTACVSLILDCSWGGRPRVERNAILESVLIHARCLVKFLEWGGPPPTHHPDDIVPYVFDATWVGGVPDPATKTAVDRIHKQVAHLTKGRTHGEGTNPATKNWDVRALALSVLEKMKVFYVHIGQQFPVKAEGLLTRLRTEPRGPLAGETHTSSGSVATAGPYGPGVNHSVIK